MSTNGVDGIFIDRTFLNKKRPGMLIEHFMHMIVKNVLIAKNAAYVTKVFDLTHQ